MCAWTFVIIILFFFQRPKDEAFSRETKAAAEFSDGGGTRKAEFQRENENVRYGNWGRWHAEGQGKNF